MDDNGTDVLIIGGGAAGIAAAIAAAGTGASVTLLEKDGRIGKKILVTGNGRCNLSNTSISATGDFSFYNDPAFVKPTLVRYDCDALRRRFEDFGLLTIADERGWVFPRTRWANSVLDVLLDELRRLEVDFRCNEEALNVEPLPQGGFWVKTDKGGISATELVLACGGGVTRKLLETQTRVPPTAILAPLNTDLDAVKGLDGIRCVCRVSVLDKDGPKAQETGELLFRSYGVSGIVIFNLSRFAEAGNELSLDFFPEFSRDELLALLAARKSSTFEDFFDGLLHSRIAAAILRRASLSKTDSPNDKTLDEMANTITTLANIVQDYRIRITAEPDKIRSQVTRGGFATESFNPLSLESLIHPGVFAAGECLDIDGPCGGFNLHWAFASGLVAGLRYHTALPSDDWRQ